LTIVGLSYIVLIVRRTVCRDSSTARRKGPDTLSGATQPQVVKEKL